MEREAVPGPAMLPGWAGVKQPNQLLIPNNRHLSWPWASSCSLRFLPPVRLACEHHIKA